MGCCEPAEREAVEAGLARMQKLLAGHERVEELGIAERVELAEHAGARQWPAHECAIATASCAGTRPHSAPTANTWSARPTAK